MHQSRNRLLMIVIVLLMTSVTAFAQTVTAVGVVNTGRLNMRAEPSPYANIVFTITQGDVVALTGKNSNSSWYQVNFEGISGWVNGSYLTLTNAHVVPVVNTTTPTVVVAPSVGTVTTGRLNIRSEPSINGAIIRTMSRGDSVAVIAKNGSTAWYQITFDGTTGWVNGSYMTITNADTVPRINVSVSTSPVVTAPSIGTVNAGRLNMRAEPSPSAPILLTMSQGDSVAVIAKNGSTVWYQVTFNGTTGWVNGTYMTITNADTVPRIQTTLSLVTGHVSTGMLNIRSMPSPFFNQPLASVPRNTGLVIIGRTADNSWLKIQTDMGVEGWVSERYVTITYGNVNDLPIQ